MEDADVNVVVVVEVPDEEDEIIKALPNKLVVAEVEY